MAQLPGVFGCSLTPGSRLPYTAVESTRGESKNVLRPNIWAELGLKGPQLPQNLHTVIPRFEDDAEAIVPADPDIPL